MSLTFSVNDIFASQKGSWPTLAKTDFGQTDFGQNRLWPKPTLAKTDFGQTDFGQTDFGQTDFDLACVVLCVVCVAWVLFHCVKVGLHVWVLVSRFGLDRPSWDSPSLDRPSPGLPKISLFFSLSRHKIHSFFPYLGVFSLNFGGVFEGQDPQMCTFGLSAVVWNPGPPFGPPPFGPPPFSPPPFSPPPFSPPPTEFQQISTNFQHLFHTLHVVLASICFKNWSPLGNFHVCIRHSGTLHDHAIHVRPQLVFHRPDGRFECVIAHTFRQIMVWHAGGKEPRVHIDKVAHPFHMFLQISEHVLRVGPHPLGVFLHSRYERSRTSYSFVVPCWNKTCSLRQRFGLLWIRLWCFRSSGLVRDSRSASGFLCGSRRRRAMAFGHEQSPRTLESVVVLFSHVQERELVAHHVEVNPLPAQRT